MDVQFAQAELYLSKIKASHFSILNMKIANQNMMERILIAMHNENMAKSNENFRMGAELPSWGGATTKISLVLVHFGLIKLKPNQKTIVFPTYFTC